MSELDRVMLGAIRYRVRSPSASIGTAAKDRAWLLDRIDRRDAAIRILFEAVEGGADGYEVQPELAALGDAAGLPVPDHWRDRQRPAPRQMFCAFCGDSQGTEDFTSVLSPHGPLGWHPRCWPDRARDQSDLVCWPDGSGGIRCRARSEAAWQAGDVAYLELPEGADAPSGWTLIDGRHWTRVLQAGDVLPPGRLEIERP